MHLNLSVYSFLIGLLESVSNLTVTSFNSTTVLISWSPPFTLEGVPILGYSVNITSGKNNTITTFVTETILLYSIDNLNLKNNFTVTIVPVNKVGPGRISCLKYCLLCPSKLILHAASNFFCMYAILAIRPDVIIITNMYAH